MKCIFGQMKCFWWFVRFKKRCYIECVVSEHGCAGSKPCNSFKKCYIMELCKTRLNQNFFRCMPGFAPSMLTLLQLSQLLVNVVKRFAHWMVLFVTRGSMLHHVQTGSYLLSYYKLDTLCGKTATLATDFDQRKTGVDLSMNHPS